MELYFLEDASGSQSGWGISRWKKGETAFVAHTLACQLIINGQAIEAKYKEAV